MSLFPHCHQPSIPFSRYLLRNQDVASVCLFQDSLEIPIRVSVEGSERLLCKQSLGCFKNILSNMFGNRLLSKSRMNDFEKFQPMDVFRWPQLLTHLRPMRASIQINPSISDPHKLTFSASLPLLCVCVSLSLS